MVQPQLSPSKVVFCRGAGGGGSNSTPPYNTTPTNCNNNLVILHHIVSNIYFFNVIYQLVSLQDRAIPCKGTGKSWIGIIFAPLSELKRAVLTLYRSIKERV